MILIVDERKTKADLFEREILFDDFWSLEKFLENYEKDPSQYNNQKIEKIVLYDRQYERALSIRFYGVVTPKLEETMRKYTVQLIP